ncbi:MAG: sigma 54-interacting transcriptional regulator [Planctomycetota bacterium]|nr:sigma 54-interacting transcriptional regulator [Planctomycetota bacterium]
MTLRDDILASFDQLLGRCSDDDPGLLEELRRRIEEVLASRGAAAGDDAGWHGLIGECAAMLELRVLIEKFARAAAPVLITGESGTGKERVAHAVHALSPRSMRPFVAENCAAIPESLLESVLFGHKKGAFTGAVHDHPGHFVAADKGTLFLDEIGELAAPMQAKLLRALQDGEVRAVGGTRARKVDVRVVAATNQDLEAAVREGRFREDLYFRVNVLRLPLPPLRDRGDDVVLLARGFLAEACARAGRSLTLSEGAEQALCARRWPGNVRQHQNEMMRLSALAAGPMVAADEVAGDGDDR